MSVATGECVAFVDSDDWIAPEMLERLLFAMEKDGSDIAACSVEMVWEDDTPSRMLTVKMDRVLNREEAQTALLRETLLKQPVWYKLYKRSLICDIPFEVGKYHEDVFWSYQAIGRAKRVSLIDYIGYYYTQRSGSIMGASYSLNRLDALEAVEKRYEYLKQEFPSLAQDAKVSILAECIYHGQMALKDLNKDEKKQVFTRLNNTKKKYDFQYRDFIGRKLTHRIWLNLARCSLLLVCQLKNAMKVGL